MTARTCRLASLFTALLATCLWAGLPGEGEEEDLKEARDDPRRMIRLALRERAWTLSTGAFGNYLAMNVREQEDDVIERILAFAEDDDRMHHAALLIACCGKSGGQGGGLAATIVDGLMTDPDGHPLAASVLCAQAMMDAEMARKTAWLSGFGIGPPARGRGGRKARGRRKGGRRAKAAPGPVPHPPIPEALLQSDDPSTLQPAIMAAAYWADESLSGLVDRIRVKGPGIAGAKALYAAAIGREVDDDTLDDAFEAEPGRESLIAEVCPELSRYTPLLPDAALAARAVEMLGDGDRIGLLRRALGHPDIRVRFDAVRALGTLGGTSAVKSLTQRLQDCEWPLVIEIADALSRHPDKRSIPTLLERLQAETGRVRIDLLHALCVIAGESKGESTDDWIDWYRTQGRSFEVDLEQSAEYRRNHRVQNMFVNPYTYFYSINVFSNRFVYVVDTSLSMKGDRIASLRAHLIESVERIRRGGHYNIVDFGGDVVTMERRGLTESLRTGMRRAEKMPLTLATRTYDALEASWLIPDVDTLILLSGGAPVRSKIKAWNDIRRALLLVNRYRPISVSCIDFDPKAGNQAAMKRLATENHGWHESVAVDPAPGNGGRRQAK